MPNYHITPASSIFTGLIAAFDHTLAGDAGSTLLIDPGAFLVSSNAIGDGARLKDFNSVTVKGAIGAYGGGGWGLNISAPALSTRVLNVTVGVDGSIFGGSQGIHTNQITNITNSGGIHGDGSYAIYEIFAGAANYKIINNKTGTIDSDSAAAIFITNAGNHTITNAGVITGGAGVAIDTTAADNVTLTNTGTINGNIDLESSGASKVTLTSGNVNGNVLMGAGADTVKTGSGSYYSAFLGDGADQFFGGGKSDFVNDGGGSDKITLGGGNDWYYAVKAGVGVDGTDTVDGGGGKDAYYAFGAAAGVSIDLKTGTATVDGHTDTIKNFETVYGSGFTDVLIGSDKADTLYGGGGGDFFTGGKGADSIYGNIGAVDFFVYTDTKQSGVTATTRDNIFNFEAGIGGDTIFLAGVDANTTIFGDQAFALAPGISAFTGVAGELVQQMTAGGLTLFGDVNGDAKADMSITLNGYFDGPITGVNLAL